MELSLLSQIKDYNEQMCLLFFVIFKRVYSFLEETISLNRITRDVNSFWKVYNTHFYYKAVSE